MKRATLAQDAVVLEKSPTKAAAPATDNQLQDCPDCFDTMLEFCDWDKMKYLCENCGLIIANPLFPSTFRVQVQ